MEETVAGLYRVLANEVVRRVAVIAGGRGVMAGLDPAIILRVHHMAVGAGAGIVGKVGVAFSIDKSVSADAKRDAQQSRQSHFEPHRPHANLYQSLSCNASSYGIIVCLREQQPTIEDILILRLKLQSWF
jgi:hypothetical protein